MENFVIVNGKLFKLSNGFTRIHFLYIPPYLIKAGITFADEDFNKSIAMQNQIFCLVQTELNSREEVFKNK